MGFGIKSSFVWTGLKRIPVLRGIASRLHPVYLRSEYEVHWRLLRNPHSRRRFLTQPPQLVPAQKQILASLRRDGVAIFQFSDLLTDPTSWLDLCEMANSFACSARVRDGIRAYREEWQNLDGLGLREGGVPPTHVEKLKKYWITLYDDDPTISLRNPLLRAVMAQPVLDLANSYFELWSKLHYVDLWYSIPIDAARPRVGSQEWHRDPEDRRKLRLYLYFSEVDEHAGALQYMRGSCQGGPYENLWRWRLAAGHYPPQEELELRVPRTEWITCVGGPGTMVLCDTAGFHRGGLATTGGRLLATWAFLTPASPYQRRYDVDWGDGEEQLSPAARFALE